MRDFDERRKQFNIDSANTQKWNCIFQIGIFGFVIGTTGFVFWVIIMLMKFYGVI